MTLTYGSVCSGIEAASIAWEPLGFNPAWFSEIESFPSALLQHHWPHVVNLGDMTNIVDMLSIGVIPAPDVLVGGTPCQAFSLAGLRGGLSDSRGQLTLEYVRILNEIDRQRSVPAIAVWENVPGVLSDKSNAFGYFLAGLAGESQPLEPTGRKWTNSGYVLGPQRAVAWRVLDAQYFGVAQRRRRVFVVASARDGFDPAKVLFEFDGVRRDIAPSRETREETAGNAGKSIAVSSGHGYWLDAKNLAATLRSQDSITKADTLVATGYRMTAFGEYADDETSSTMKARDYKDATDLAVHGFQPRIARNGRGDMGEVCHTQSAQAGNTGNGDAAPCVANGGQESLTPWEQQGLRIQGVNGVAPTLMSNPNGGMKIEPVLSTGVRRLTPVECERLQGFPDNHTLLPHRPADGPRYKALGNSMAVPVMRWIGKRIQDNLA